MGDVGGSVADVVKEVSGFSLAITLASVDGCHNVTMHNYFRFLVFVLYVPPRKTYHSRGSIDKWYDDGGCAITVRTQPSEDCVECIDSSPLSTTMKGKPTSNYGTPPLHAHD